MIVKGHNFRIFLDDAGLYAADDCSVDIDVSTISLSHKDINPGSTGTNSQINVADIISASFSSSGKLYGIESNVAAILTKQLNGTVVAVEMTTDVTGDIVISFNAIITASSFGGSDGDIATVSFSGVSTGDITNSVVA